MSEGGNKEVKLSLKVMINKEKSKVLFAEANGQFVDILLSFLTLPLGRILKVLEKQFGDEAPTIGSLSSLYHSLANLDASLFWTNGAKEVLLDPTSSFEAECERLKLDITDSPPAEYFCCSSCHKRLRCVSIYYDKAECASCWLSGFMKKEVANKGCEAATCTDGAFTIQTASFIISEDLHIFPNETGLLAIVTTLGITDMDNAHPIKVDFGFTEFMKLLKASLTSPTPLSDIILNKTTRMSATTATQPMIAKQDNPNSGDLLLKVVIQKSTGKLLYAQANKNFIEFLFGLLVIPLGGVEHLLAGETCFKAINNLYRSTANRIHGEHLKTPDTKKRLIQPNLPHGYISENHILPLTEESLPVDYTSHLSRFSSVKFPNGKGSYLQRPPTYEVKDDLTVTPFCVFSISSNLIKQKIPISDVKEVELQIGLKECLSILQASLSSTSALTDALLTTQMLSNKQPKPEPWD